MIDTDERALAVLDGMLDGVRWLAESLPCPEGMKPGRPKSVAMIEEALVYLRRRRLAQLDQSEPVAWIPAAMLDPATRQDFFTACAFQVNANSIPLYIHPDRTQAPGESGEWVLVRKEAIDWLNGESGEFVCPPDRYFRGEPAPYWWRSVFRDKAAIAAASTPGVNHE